MFDESFDTNCTLSDQILGLKWVKDNIEQFGGNPTGNQVTWPAYEGKHGNVHAFDLNQKNDDLRIAESIFKLWEKMGLMYDEEN